ncbi:MAG TPA: alpha/beta fold hydrolase, partial [Pseudorhizobium sp.]|nr:alpha/beta fold hydrolase [Pseudorhizobium sp.]
MQFVRIGGVTIAYDVAMVSAANPVLVLINSLGTDSRIWHLVVPKLAEDFTVVTYDKRGHGLSDLGNPPYRIEDHVADLEGLLDHLEFSQVILCGLSVGGLVAQGLYAQRPDLVKAMVLADTAHKIGTAEMWNKRIGAIEENGVASILDDIMSRWFTEPFRSHDNGAYRAYCNMLLRQPADGYLGTCAAIRDADFTQHAA